MIRPSQSVLEAIAVMKLTPEFTIFMEWFIATRQVLQNNNNTMKDDLQLRWNQGKIQNITDIIDAIDNVFVLLDAYKEYQPSGINPDI